MAASEDLLVEKLRSLPADLRNEVEDFVDFVLTRAAGRETTQMMTKASEASFSRIWDNAQDAEYDRL